MLQKNESFRKKLARRQELTGSLVCIGLDPLPDKLPLHLRSEAPHKSHLATDIAIWMMGIVDATAIYAAMYKLQKAHWEAIPNGAFAMQMVIKYIETNYPEIVIFEDCKRGDIGRTQACYKVAQLQIDGAEGMNYSPYMGKDCLEFLTDKDYGVGLVGLCYTSNSSAREVQDVLLADGSPYWEFMAKTILKWSEDLGVVENSGLVMAAAYEYPKGSGMVYSQHLSRCRVIVGDKLWFLIPGVGTQKGFIRETVQAAWAGWGSIVINSSSDIIFASQGEDFAEAAAEKAKLLYNALLKALRERTTVLNIVPESLTVAGNPLETLKNCQGFYESLKDNNENYLGPVVAYAKKYSTPDGDKNMVGFNYLNFAKAEQYPAVRNWFADLIARKIKATGLEVDVVLGAPMGGIKLATDLARHLKCQKDIFAEKIVKVVADKPNNVREVSELSIERHGLERKLKVAIVEDVCNNFSTSADMCQVIESYDAEVVGIVCAFNRSGKDYFEKSTNEKLPVISACEIALDQYQQDDPAVLEHIKNGNIVLKPKTEWKKLEEAMTS